MSARASAGFCGWRRQLVLGALFTVAIVGGAGPSSAEAAERLLVGFDEGVTAAQRGEAHRAVGARVVLGRTGVPAMQVIRAPDGALAKLRRRDDVAWVERDVRVEDAPRQAVSAR